MLQVIETLMESEQVFSFFTVVTERLLTNLSPGNTNQKEILSTVDLHIKVACIVKSK